MTIRAAGKRGSSHNMPALVASLQYRLHDHTSSEGTSWSTGGGGRGKDVNARNQQQQRHKQRMRASKRARELSRKTGSSETITRDDQIIRLSHNSALSTFRPRSSTVRSSVIDRSSGPAVARVWRRYGQVRPLGATSPAKSPQCVTRSANIQIRHKPGQGHSRVHPTIVSV